MERIMCAVKRASGVLVFALVCFVALLYGMGKFDFVFIERDLPISGRGNAETELPPMSDEDKELQDYVGGMEIGDNLSGVISGGHDKEEETDAEGGKNDTPQENEHNTEYYPSLDFLLSEGYYINTGEYMSSEADTLAELLLDFPTTLDQVKGKKTVKVDSPICYEDGGEYFYNAAEAEDYRFSYEAYMGYLLAYDSSTVTVFTSTGDKVGTYSYSQLSPAFVRDSLGNPLFTDEKGRYFHFDSDGRKMYSSYIDERDSIGLYFNYSRSFGASDNPLKLFYRYEDVYFIDEIDTSDYYIRSSIDPELAYSIYIMRPSYAEKVARSNPRFALALEEAKARVEEEKRLEEERKNEQLTAESETLPSPESDTEAPVTELESTLTDNSGTDTEEIGAESDSDTAFAESETETAPDTEIETETETNIETETESDTEAETVIETETETDTAEETETVKAPETSSDPNILVIERTLNLIRYGYGYAGMSETADCKYAKAYNFSEGRAAVVDDDGVLRFINPPGEVVIDGTGTKMVTASRYITTEYAEPLYRNSENSKGYLYFDNGLVRVRKLERDYTFKNLIYSDSDVLLYPDGSEFKIPYGYTLVSYSEGVLVLKGQDGKYGYYHKDGYWIAQPVYTEIRPFSEGLGVIGFLGGKKGVIDKTGSIVIPFAYEYITAPSEGVMTLYSYENGWKLIVKTKR